ncbi:hypothetical protein RS030_4506 [Cryptosporidium xiaoi]|uniref:Transcription factor TFIIIC triple barrel domain-containing protein n=1 Tax=Cryptosporidium xiaoi TaxID=659607 RepID=A0AAV9XVG5_9CRYT
MKFELNIESKENTSEDELIKFKFQGNSLKTIGTCMFFNINNEHEDHTSFKQSYSYNDNIEINNSNNLDKMSEKTTSKIEYIGKCNSVIQAFIQD